MSPATDSAAGLVLVERRERAAFVTLNRPDAANALSKGLVSALEAVFSELAALIKKGDDLRAVVLTGTGKVFSAGADLKERRAMTLEQTWGFLDELNRLMNAVAAFPRPVVAAINGAAFGGGLELALACDLRIAADTAELGLTEVRLGIIPGAGGTQRLTRIAGVAAAKELILTGRRVRAQRAYALGIVSDVVPAETLADAAGSSPTRSPRRGRSPSPPPSVPSTAAPRCRSPTVSRWRRRATRRCWRATIATRGWRRSRRNAPPCSKGSDGIAWARSRLCRAEPIAGGSEPC